MLVRWFVEIAQRFNSAFGQLLFANVSSQSNPSWAWPMTISSIIEYPRQRATGNRLDSFRSTPMRA